MKSIQPIHDFVLEGARHYVYHASTNQGLPRHSHSYAHATVCHGGKLAVRKEGIYIEMTKETTPILLKAGEWHELEALEDNTVFENIFKDGAY